MAAVQVNVTVLSITVNQIVGTFFFRFFFCVRFFYCVRLCCTGASFVIIIFFVVFLFKLNGRSLSTLARARAREILFFFGSHRPYRFFTIWNGCIGMDLLIVP